MFTEFPNIISKHGFNLTDWYIDVRSMYVYEVNNCVNILYKLEAPKFTYNTDYNLDFKDTIIFWDESILTYILCHISKGNTIMWTPMLRKLVQTCDLCLMPDM